MMENTALEAKLRDEIRNAHLDPGFKYALCTLAMLFRGIKNNDHYREICIALENLANNKTHPNWFNSSLARMDFLNKSYHFDGCDQWNFKKESFKHYCTRTGHTPENIIINQSSSALSTFELKNWIDIIQKENFISL